MFYSQQDRRSCAGKRAYTTIGEAERAIKGLGARFRRGTRHKKVHVYRCNCCQAWHVSSMERGEHEERIHQHVRFYESLETA